MHCLFNQSPSMKVLISQGNIYISDKCSSLCDLHTLCMFFMVINIVAKMCVNLQLMLKHSSECAIQTIPTRGSYADAFRVRAQVEGIV